MAAYLGGLGLGLSQARKGFNEENKRFRDEERQKLIDKQLADTVETQMVQNKATRDRTPGLLAAQMEGDKYTKVKAESDIKRSVGLLQSQIASDELTKEQALAQLDNLPFTSKAEREKAKTDIASNEAKRSLIPDEMYTKRKMNESARAGAQRTIDTSEAKTKADIHAANAQAAKSKLEKLVANEQIESGVPSLAAEIQFGDAMRDFLGEVYKTTLVDGNRAAELINDFDIDQDGNPDIVGAHDIVIDEAKDTMTVVDESGEVVMDGSTGEPAIYSVKEFKKMTEKKDAKGKGGSSKTPQDKFLDKAKAVDRIMRQKHNLMEHEVIDGESAQEYDMILGVLDVAETAGIKINQALSKFGTMEKIMAHTGMNNADLDEAVLRANEKFGDDVYNKYSLLAMLFEKRMTQSNTKGKTQSNTKGKTQSNTKEKTETDGK